MKDNNTQDAPRRLVILSTGFVVTEERYREMKDEESEDK